MNIAFLTTLNPNDINSWSGTTFHVFNTLKKRHNVKVIGINMFLQLTSYSFGNFSDKSTIDRYSQILGNLCSEQIKLFSGCDLVFFGDLYLAPFLQVNMPIIHFSDVTYHSFRDYLDRKEDEETIQKIEMIEKNLLTEKYTTIIYSSEWAKLNTIKYYGIDPRKIHIVEFGANIPTPEDYIIKIDVKVCNLVFIGKNWFKKGGDKVLGAYYKLKSEGFPCTLTIIGSVPEILEGEKDLTIIPFLNKSNPIHMKKLCNILKNAHFLVLPTEYDAFGIVFCEASAYAVPSIATNVCGVSQPIHEGKNGYLLPLNATADDYAKKIRVVFENKEDYYKLRASSRHEFETRLNWNVWEKKVNKILEETVQNYKNRVYLSD